MPSSRDEGHDYPTYDDSTRMARDDVMAELFELLGRPHTVAIARRFACDPGPWRYSELEATLDVSPTTLSRRLDGLEQFGIVERRSYDETPPRVEYSTPPRGEALRPMFEQANQWVESAEAENE